MKKHFILLLFQVLPLMACAQFSLGADLLGVGLTNIQQKEMGLSPEAGLRTSRLVFSFQNNLVGTYHRKNWAFSVGLGHQYYFWQQRFRALNNEVGNFMGVSEVLDSSNFLGRVTYSNQLICVPVGVKYFLGNKNPESIINAFFGLSLTPSFAAQERVDAIFFQQGFIFRNPVAESVALEQTSERYFKAKLNPVLLDGKATVGFRIWGRRRTFAVDLSGAYLYGFVPFHEQMGHNKGLFSNVSLHFFFKNRSAEKIDAPKE